MNTALAIVQPSVKALAAATSIPEIKALRDEAMGAKEWAKKRGLGIEAENRAAEFILRAERKLGEQLAAMIEKGELATKGKSQGVVIHADLGIKQQDSWHFRRLAALPEELFEQMIGAAQANRERLAKVDFYRAQSALTKDATPEVPIDKGFDMFRAGVYHMLGWSVDKSGVGGPTRNDLLNMPFEDVKQIVSITQALIKAITEYKTEKGIG